MIQNKVFLLLPNIRKNLALMSFSRSAQEKSCDRFVHQDTDFKKTALVLSSATTCKKIGDGLVPQDAVSKNADGPCNRQ